MAILIPRRLAAACSKTPEGAAWLGGLPNIIGDLQRRWSLALGPPFDGQDVSCAWVATAQRRDGTSAVLKVGMPHMEAEHEIQALRFLGGDPTVLLLAADEEVNAMLIERCEPGTALRLLPEPEQDVVLAQLLRRLWRVPPASQGFRPLPVMLAHWSAETMVQAAHWPDSGLVQEGLRLFEELPRSAHSEALLATDLHAGNVLRAQRKPWLVIDPKPFVGGPAYDATQHLFNCLERLRVDPDGTIRRFRRLARY